MSINVVNTMPYLRSTREYPKDDPKQLSIELHKSYLDIATAVNNRTIGIFPTNNPAIGGESWFLTSQKQQNLRQVYTFTGVGSIAHNLRWASIAAFTKPFGSYTDGTNWYGVIFASSTTIAGQVTFYVTPTNIVIQQSGGPAIQSGIIVLEWISQI
jgi:hypothetical protein